MVSGGQEPQPVPAQTLAIVAGRPTDEELAAVVVVLSARAGQAGPAVTPARSSAWSARSQLTRAPLAVGPGAWRASALPR